jgi:hypothetical protein
MWINRDVDLPQALVAAQREGRLVIFAGAGVSMGPPANLPSFEDLAIQIAGGALDRRPTEPLDAYLGRVEQHGINIQARARQFIDVETSTPRPLHHALISLFRDESAVRVVTTNFDRHFTTALRGHYPHVDIFTAPALPLGRDWTGLTYLHGAVERERSHLIVTDRDFGQAYLADAWATRFLMTMFEAYVVLFVGYSHADPVMRYLARSFVGGTSRFALTLPDQDDHWTHLGIVPVHFPKRVAPDEYGALDDAIESWNAAARMGVFDHRLRIAQLVALPPPLEPENIDYLRGVVADPVTLRFFVELATLREWLDWAMSERLLHPLIGPEPLGDTGRLVAHWFAERFVVPHANAALQFVQNHLATLNPGFADAIAFRLAVGRDPLPDGVLRLWATALAAADNTHPHTLERLLRACVDTGDNATALVLFRVLLRPRLRFDPVWTGLHDETSPSLDVELALRGQPYDLRDAWDRSLRAEIPTLNRHFLALAAEWVYEASGLLRAAGKASGTWDPLSFHRAAIEEHEQDHTHDDWGLIIDIGRDNLDWAVTHDTALASATIASWITAGPSLLKRLGIHGTARRTDVSASDRLDLIERHEWLYDSGLKHETFELLRAVFSRATDDAQRRFVAYSMDATVLPAKGEIDEDTARTITYERYNVAVWLAHVAPDSLIAQEHLAQLQERHPDFAPRTHPDMDHWISSGWVGPRSPITTHDLLNMHPSDAATYVSGYQPERPGFDGPDRSGLMTIFSQVAAQDRRWAMSVARSLVAAGRWDRDVWGSLLQAWRGPTLSDSELREVLALLDEHAHVGATAALEAARLTEDALDRTDLVEADIARIEQISERLLTISGDLPPSVYTNGVLDWLTSALNHPAGVVAMAWIKAVSKRMSASADGWGGLTPDTRDRFERLIHGEGHNASLARVMFASQVHFLFRADRAWTEVNVVPLFDWAANADRASQAWHGFLTWGRWNDPLFGCMLPFTQQAFTRIDALGEQAHAFVTALANVAAYSQLDPWVNAGWLFQFVREASEAHRAEWARTFGRSLEVGSTEGRLAIWQRWLSTYWQARITGVPRPLAGAEREAMVAWVCALKGNLQDVIRFLASAPPDVLDHFTLYRLKQCGLAESHSAAIGKLLADLLPYVTEVRHDTGELFDLAAGALAGGADRADVRRIAAEMLRLGRMDGERLRRMADDAPDGT